MKNKIVITMAITVTMTSAFAATINTFPHCIYHFMDAGGDGEITSADEASITAYLDSGWDGKAGCANLLMLDTDGNRIINNKDVLNLRRFLADRGEYSYPALPLGDANGDGLLVRNLSEVSGLADDLDWILTMAQLSQRGKSASYAPADMVAKAADVDGNGRVTAEDAALLNAILDADQGMGEYPTLCQKVFERQFPF
ncbi:MAG: hypothetical protein Tsb002_16870 [Wenzhouxiangellaceae bacterium]